MALVVHPGLVGVAGRLRPLRACLPSDLGKNFGEYGKFSTLSDRGKRSHVHPSDQNSTVASTVADGNTAGYKGSSSLTVCITCSNRAIGIDIWEIKSRIEGRTVIVSFGEKICWMIVFVYVQWPMFSPSRTFQWFKYVSLFCSA